MSVAIIPDFVKYQIDWLTSHKGLEFEPVIEDTIVQMLKDTGKSFIDEQPDETSQFDHIADSGRMVERTDETAQNVQNEDLIQRKAAIEAINGMIDRFERILADIRESKCDDSVCGMCEYDGAYMGQSGDWCNECPGFDKDDCFKLSDRCRKRWMGDIVLPSAQPKQNGKWIYNSPTTMKCDRCGFAIKDWDWHRFKYCPNCRADMRGKQDE